MFYPNPSYHTSKMGENNVMRWHLSSQQSFLYKSAFMTECVASQAESSKHFDQYGKIINLTLPQEVNLLMIKCQVSKVP